MIQIYIDRFLPWYLYMNISKGSAQAGKLMENKCRKKVWAEENYLEISTIIFQLYTILKYKGLHI